jgi:hypothetical protein
MLPWAAPNFLAVKGIAHEPTAMAAMKPEARDALLAAIARGQAGYGFPVQADLTASV